MNSDLESRTELENARVSFIIAVRDKDPLAPQYLETYKNASDKVYKAPVGFGQVPKKEGNGSKGWGQFD